MRFPFRIVHDFPDVQRNFEYLEQHAARNWLVPSGGDDTAAINAACAEGQQLGPGTFLIAGTVDVPLNRDLIGAGSAAVTLQLGPNGQIRHGNRLANTIYRGGITEGFTVDGQGSQNVAGGGFYIGFCGRRQFRDISVSNCAGDNTVIETAQNCTFTGCTWDNAGRSSFVLDYGTGGHSFFGCHFGAGGTYPLEFRQTGVSAPGVYPTSFGPSDNCFYNCITEYAVAGNQAMIYHGAGGQNHFYDHAISGTGATSPASLLIAESAANAVSTTGTYTTSANTMTVASNANLQQYMTAKGPGIIPGTIMTFVGTTVTLSTTPLSNHTNASVSFGAVSKGLEFHGSLWPGTVGQTVAALDLRGGTTVGIYGTCTIENVTTAFLMTGNDQITLSAQMQYFNITNRWLQQAGDTLTLSAYVQISDLRDAAIAVITHDSPYSGFWQAKAGNSFPDVQTGLGALYLGDGVHPLGSIAIQYATDTHGLNVVQSTVPLLTNALQTTGLAGLSSDTRFLGQLLGVGPPTGGTFYKGDWVTDLNGSVWTCTTGGTPGTWAGPGVWAGLTAAGNVVAIPGGQAPRYKRDASGKVWLDGDLQTSAAYVANTAFFSAALPANCRPAFVHLYPFAQGAAVGFIQVLANGTVNLNVAIGAAGVNIPLDGINFPTD